MLPRGLGFDRYCPERSERRLPAGIGWRASEIQTIAREAEEAGFDAIFAAEVNNDVMATAQLMGAASEGVPL